MTGTPATDLERRDHSPRVGLVLGAGGVAGHAFHVGVLRALQEATGWDPRRAEIVVGTSAGSVIGLGLRAGLAAPDLFARTVGEPLSAEADRLLAPLPPPSEEAWWARTLRPRIPVPAAPVLLARLLATPWRIRPGVALAAMAPEGRLDISRISEDADALLASAGGSVGGLWVVAVRLGDGRRVVFGRPGGRVPEGWTWGQAVAASCAIPGFFSPVVINGTRLVDGGAHSPTNVDLLVREALDLVIVSSPMSSVRTAGRRSLDVPVRAAYRLRLAAEVARLRRAGVSVVVFQPTAPVLSAAGLNAMNPALRVPVARASYGAARLRCARDDFLHQAAALAA